MEKEIENIIRTTLVIENKQSVYIAVKRILDLFGVNSSALTELEIKLLLPLIEKRRLEIEDYTIEFHELGHTIEKLKEITD